MTITAQKTADYQAKIYADTSTDYTVAGIPALQLTRGVQNFPIGYRGRFGANPNYRAIVVDNYFKYINPSAANEFSEPANVYSGVNAYIQRAGYNELNQVLYVLNGSVGFQYYVQGFDLTKVGTGIVTTGRKPISVSGTSGVGPVVNNQPTSYTASGFNAICYPVDENGIEGSPVTLNGTATFVPANFTTFNDGTIDYYYSNGRLSIDPSQIIILSDGTNLSTLSQIANSCDSGFCILDTTTPRIIMLRPNYTWSQWVLDPSDAQTISLFSAWPSNPLTIAMDRYDNIYMSDGQYIYSNIPPTGSGIFPLNGPKKSLLPSQLNFSQFQPYPLPPQMQRPPAELPQIGQCCPDYLRGY